MCYSENTMSENQQQLDVLVIDDDPDIEELYRMAFSKAGISVKFAKDAESGLAAALAEKPKVILLDIMMPGDMDGHEMFAKLRLDDWGKSAKVIFLTNMSSPLDISKAVNRGSNEYIIKSNALPDEVVNQVRIAMYTD